MIDPAQADAADRGFFTSARVLSGGANVHDAQGKPQHGSHGGDGFWRDVIARLGSCTGGQRITSGGAAYSTHTESSEALAPRSNRREDSR